MNMLCVVCIYFIIYSSLNHICKLDVIKLDVINVYKLDVISVYKLDVINVINVNWML